MAVISSKSIFIEPILVKWYSVRYLGDKSQSYQHSEHNCIGCLGPSSRYITFIRIFYHILTELVSLKSFIDNVINLYYK